MFQIKRLVFVLVLALLMGCSGAERTEKPDVGDNPNVVIITWHDAGRWFGCYGNNHVHTPNIDALASEGFLFTNYYSNSSVCSPSRSAMLTGRYPQSNGCVGLAHGPYNWSIHAEEDHLSELLQDSGYDTRLFGWQHEVTHDRVEERLGFNETYLNDPLPPCNEVVDTFLHYISHRNEEEGPFYAQIGFFETHRPFDFGGVGPDTSKGLYVPPYLNETAKAREEIALMQGSLRKADAQTGRILEAIRENGFEENTIMVFTVDHGAHFPRAKATNYDPGIEVPLIIRWPGGGITGGKATNYYCSHVDFFPTLLELLEFPVKDHIQGKSFAGVFTGEEPEPLRDGAIFGMFINVHRFIRTKEYKLIINFTPKSTFKELPVSIESQAKHPIYPWVREEWPLGELYDLEKDPNEFTNLYYDPGYSAVVRELSARLLLWMQSIEDPIIKGPMPDPWYGSAIEDLKSNITDP
jgi:N-sulfoglucosamine sulfohydrolase